ncbi:MAG: hypothetical protein IJ864_00350 [Alphaproteobacteria bacterium]|nr:hypothetical protein [Alphaproteobacteria bacterium]
MNKNLSFLVLIAAMLSVSSVSAVELLRLEDENIVLNTEEQHPADLQNEVPEMADIGGTEEILFVVSAKDGEQIPEKPFRGQGLQDISVPQEINGTVQNYQRGATITPFTADLTVNPHTPRSLEYPIGRERAEADAWRYELYEPRVNRSNEDEAFMQQKQIRDEAYLKKINACKDSRAEEIDMEMALLRGDDFIHNAAYLSQTMAELAQCYDDLGMEIIDELYDGDNDILREYNKKSATFEVKSSAPNFDTRYCENGVCGFAAVAMAQLEKFDDFRAYLSRLVIDAPVKKRLQTKFSDLPMVDDEDALAAEQNLRRKAAVKRRKVNIRPADTVYTATQRNYQDHEVVYLKEVDY